MKFIPYADLKPRKGIPGSKVTLWRKERQRKFPRRKRFGVRFYVWDESIIDRYMQAIADGYSEEDAVKIAERDCAEAV